MRAQPFGHTHADRERQAQVIGLQRPAAHPLAEPLGQRQRVGARGGRQQRQELFAAPARQVVDVAQLRTHHGGQVLQRPVTGRMALAVVEALEMVDIDHQHRHLAGVRCAPLADQAARALFFLRQQVVHRPAVEQAGEGIVARQALQPAHQPRHQQADQHHLQQQRRHQPGERRADTEHGVLLDLVDHRVGRHDRPHAAQGQHGRGQQHRCGIEPAPAQAHAVPHLPPHPHGRPDIERGPQRGHRGEAQPDPGRVHRQPAQHGRGDQQDRLHTGVGALAGEGPDAPQQRQRGREDNHVAQGAAAGMRFMHADHDQQQAHRAAARIRRPPGRRSPLARQHQRGHAPGRRQHEILQRHQQQRHFGGAVGGELVSQRFHHFHSTTAGVAAASA